MRFATHALRKAYIVNDHEDNKTYFFDSAEAARQWKRELIEDFGTNGENISLLERTYDEFGNWISQKYI